MTDSREPTPSPMHDLRNTLNSIASCAYLLQNEADPENIQRLAKRLRTHAKTATSQLNEMSDALDGSQTSTTPAREGSSSDAGSSDAGSLDSRTRPSSADASQ